MALSAERIDIAIRGGKNPKIIDSGTFEEIEKDNEYDLKTIKAVYALMSMSKSNLNTNLLIFGLKKSRPATMALNLINIGDIVIKR